MQKKLPVLVYCMRSVAPVVYRATKTFPVTCPPLSAETFNVKIFEKVRFVWLGLHGVPSSPDYLFGDAVSANPFPIRTEALSVEGIKDLNLRGVLVYAATCFLPQTSFPEAFKAAGATLIGGEGKNFGSTHRIIGVDKLGQALLNNLKIYPNLDHIDTTLRISKKVLTEGKADRDAKGFEVLKS